jgi:uncharacterized protein
MRQFTPCRFAALVAAFLTFGAAVPLGRGQNPDQDSDLPALNEKASQERLPGKFIWADLFTSHPSAAAKFYSELFGWTPHVRERRGRTYIVMSNGGRNLAGLAERPISKSSTRSRWIYYIAVPDAAAAISSSTSAGGKVLAPARAFPRRGVHAIIADNDNAVIGILQSAAGEPPDTPGQPGDWAWFELFAKNPQAAGQFYARVFNYQVAPDDRAQKEGHYILSNGDNHRGGIQPMPKQTGAQPDWLGFVQVSDIDATIAHVAGLGGEVVGSPAPAEFASRFAIISDPTGGVIGIVQFVAETAPGNAAAPGDTTTPSPGTSGPGNSNPLGTGAGNPTTSNPN